MSNIRKTNNDDSINHNTLGTISKKSTYRQMTRPLIKSPKTPSIPRLNELLNDTIFQYYFRTHFNSKEYSKFKLYTENEKLNIMIDLYFYIMNKSNNHFIEKEPMNEYDLDNENENENNDLGRLLDNLLVLDNNQSRLNVIEKMKEYKLFSLNDDNNYTERFNKIINKYKNGLNNNDNDETINYYYDKDRDNSTNMNNMNNKTNLNSLTNVNLHFNSKPLSTTKYNIGNNTDYSPVKYKTLSKINVITNYPNYNNLNDDLKTSNDGGNTNTNTPNIYNEIISPYKKDNIYDKISLSNVKLIKLGKMRKKKINLEENCGSGPDTNNRFMEYLLCPNEFDIKSKKNDIEEQDPNIYLYNNQYKSPGNYKILKPKINSELKSNISPIIFNDNDNSEIIIQEPMIICQSNVDNCKMNLLLKKQINEEETNDLIKKIYQLDGDNISFNKNEVNKIGILLLNYINLEKKFNTVEASLFIYKDKLSKMKKIMQVFSKNAMERINESNIFIKEHKIN